MIRIMRNLTLAASLPLALSACGGGSSPSAPTGTTPVQPTPSFQSAFGVVVAAYYDASITAEAQPLPAVGIIPALSLTTEPLDN